MTPAASQPKKKSIYGVHPGVAMTQKWIAELKQKTGRSLEEWLRLIKKSGPKDEKARREWLKTEHGLGTNSAWWLAEHAEGGFTKKDRILHRIPPTTKKIMDDEVNHWLKIAYERDA